MNKLTAIDCLIGFEFKRFRSGAFYSCMDEEAHPDIFDKEKYDSEYFDDKTMINPWVDTDDPDAIKIESNYFMRNSKYVKCLEDSIRIMNYNILSNNPGVSGVEEYIINCGIESIIEENQKLIDDLFDKYSERDEAHFILAFKSKITSYSDCDYDIESKVVGLFDFHTGSVVSTGCNTKRITFNGKISGDGESFCWDNVPYDQSLRIKGPDLFDMEHKNRIYPNDIFWYLDCDSDNVHQFTIIVN